MVRAGIRSRVFRRGGGMSCGRGAGGLVRGAGCNAGVRGPGSRVVRGRGARARRRRRAGVSVFSSEGAGESLGPGRVLAGCLSRRSSTAWRLCPMMRSSGWCARPGGRPSRQDGIELAAVAELDARRMAAASGRGPRGRQEHVAEELALALVLTGRSADDSARAGAEPGPVAGGGVGVAGGVDGPGPGGGVRGGVVGPGR